MKKENGQQDLFKDIGNTKIVGVAGDKEIFPREVPDKYFTETKEAFAYREVKFSCDSSFNSKIESFHLSLNEMRAYYATFMENLLPKIGTTVEKEEITSFEFRYAKQAEVFKFNSNVEEDWEKVTIPDYRGPALEDGKWKGFYKTTFKGKKLELDERMVIRFQCVDYKAVVYLNGSYVGQHEGFFAPFEFDITDYILEENELVVECRNDIPTLGVGPVLDGDKLYAATGPGWDDPEIGWHHCPAGAGICGKVTLEVRPEVHIEDIFVRYTGEGQTEIRIGIDNYTNEVKEDYELTIAYHPKNYIGVPIGCFSKTISYIGVGKNEYRFSIPIENYRMWEPDTPWLYGAVVTLEKGDACSRRIGNFGLKTFISDENSKPKGKFYFNGKPLVLRGANEMGHLQQCVMNGDMDMLIDDILIAKLCNMNYYRITQRPVQEEIYDYFDMLGMMHQCDFPLFGFLRRPQFAEAVKQTVEMEHLIRSHVSSIMVTFINEPMSLRKTDNPNDKFSKRFEAKGHRHLQRDELEAFFVAARKAIYVENPDRVIKNVEGDYDPPTAEGMPDFHSYTMWYTNHGQPIGKLMKGYLPPVKQGWMIGCGEYGAEGLDHVSMMQERYPNEWLACDDKGDWYPNHIVRAQTYSVHGDWYPEQKTVEDWVRESQKHQSVATKLMTDAFRRRSDVLNHTAIHLLIDAWPSGWMKTLVDCNRIPKPAYFAYKDSLEPLRINLYSGRRYVYEEEKIEVEAWLLNDLRVGKNVTIKAWVTLEGQEDPVDTFYEYKDGVEAASSKPIGKIRFQVPKSGHRKKVFLNACLIDESNVVVNSEKIEFYVYPQIKNEIKSIACIGDVAAQVLRELNIEVVDISRADTILMSEFHEDQDTLLDRYVREGKHIIALLDQTSDQTIRICDLELSTKSGKKIFYVASNAEAKDRVPHINDYPMYMLYNKEAGYVDFLMGRKFLANKKGKEILYTYGNETEEGCGAKKHTPVVESFQVNGGMVTVISMHLLGRLGCNANLDHFIYELVLNK